MTDVVEQRGLAVVDVAEHGDDRGARLQVGVVFLVVVAEQRLQLELGLLAGFDEQHLGTQRLGDELHHLVGQRLRAGDHLAGVEEQAHEVGRGAVQLRCQLLDGAAALDDDLALGHRRVGRRELRHRRGTEVLEVATTTLLAPGSLALRAGATASTGTTARTTTGTTAATGTAAGTTTGALEPTATTATTTAGALEATTTTTATTAGALESATTATATTTARSATTAGAGHDARAGRGRDPATTGRRRDRASGHTARRGRRRGRLGRCGGLGGRRRHGRGCVGDGRVGGGRGRPLGGGGRGRWCGDRCRRRGRRSRRGRCGRGARSGRAAVGDHPGGAHHTVRRGCRLGVGGRHLDRRRGGRGLLGGALGTRHLDGRLGLGLLPRRARPRLGLRLGCLDDRVAAQALGVGQSTDAIRGGIVDAGRMTLDADLQALGEIEHHLVLDAELPRQLVDPDLLRSQACCLLPLLLGHQFRAQTADVVVLDRGAQRPADGSPSLRLVEALRRMVPAEPGTPPRSRPGLQPGRGATEAHQLLHGRHPPAPDAGPDGRDPSRASRQPPPSNRP